MGRGLTDLQATDGLFNNVCSHIILIAHTSIWTSWTKTEKKLDSYAELITLVYGYSFNKQRLNQ